MSVGRSNTSSAIPFAIGLRAASSSNETPVCGVNLSSLDMCRDNGASWGDRTSSHEAPQRSEEQHRTRLAASTPRHCVAEKELEGGHFSSKSPRQDSQDRSRDGLA